MDYPYEQLDPERFQQLCQALLVREHKNLQCFPVAQRDGGRDAVAFIRNAQEREFLLYQVKFVRRPRSLTDERAWLLDTIKGERAKIEELAKLGAKQFVLISNVQGTAQLQAGSIDKAQRLLDTLPVPAICWWRDDLNRRLDNAWDLKWVYPELMTGPDLIRSIIERGLSDSQERRTAAIRAFVSDQHSKDSQVKFKQVELQNGLLDLYIDVPISFPWNAVNKKQHHEFRLLFNSVIQDLSSPEALRVDISEPYTVREEGFVYYSQRDEERGIGTATLLLHPSGQHYLQRIVLEGAPGQGKSTITQYVCQVHRMRLLGMAELETLPEHHRDCPVRVPFRIDLRDLAAWLERRNPFAASDDEGLPTYWQKSLESFLATQVRYHSGGIEFSVADLLAVMRISSVLLVFDGLDEVAEIKRRQDVVDEIRDGVRRLEVNASALQVIVTSRPAAFANSPGLPSDIFPYFELASVSRPLIDEYAEKWIKARRLGPSDARDVRRILKEKLDAPHLRDLARNPMQLAILLSLIHTRGASLPDKRTALYDNYVELFFNRESEKSTIVREHRYLLINIHRYLAWTLHVQAETGRGGGSIRADELEKLLKRYLDAEGHDTALVGDLFTGIVERVVAIVSRVQGTFEFEVQPLREYFAARYLYETAPYSPPGGEKRGTKLDRFDAISKNFYWLNVTRFYAGCYSVGELSSLISGLEDLLESADYRFLSHPRVLASMLLSDWVFTQHPKSVREVVALILDRIGIRFILAAGGRRGSMGASLVLPKKCGRDELLGRAIELLAQKPHRDFAYDVVELINQNDGAPDVNARWMSELKKASGEARTSWLEYGMLMGLVAKLNNLELEEITSDESLNGRRIWILLSGHQANWLAADESRAGTVVDDILGRCVTRSHGLRGKQLLEAFCSAIEPNTYIAGYYSGYSGPLADINTRRGMGGLTTYVPSDEKLSPILAACHRVVETAKEQLQRPAIEWATSLTTWNAVVEEARSIWGDRVALCHYANVAAGIRSQAEQCSDTTALFDENAPLCRRVRYARLRAGTPQWWSKQLDQIHQRVHAILACEVLITWGSGSTVVRLASKIDVVLRDLSESDWTRVHYGIEAASSIVRTHSLARTGSIDVGALPKGLSERTLVAFGLRSDEQTQLHLYETCLKKYKGRDLAVLQFCQSRALEAALAGSDGWREELSMVERCYSLGTSIPRYILHRLARPDARGRLHKDLAFEIVSKPDRYPTALVALAEMTQRVEVGKRLASVGSVAKTQRWFEPD